MAPRKKNKGREKWLAIEAVMAANYAGMCQGGRRQGLLLLVHTADDVRHRRPRQPPRQKPRSSSSPGLAGC
ncbi:unnamed protein product [Boreogadus saida]